MGHGEKSTLQVYQPLHLAGACHCSHDSRKSCYVLVILLLSSDTTYGFESASPVRPWGFRMLGGILRLSQQVSSEIARKFRSQKTSLGFPPTSRPDAFVRPGATGHHPLPLCRKLGNPQRQLLIFRQFSNNQKLLLLPVFL